MKNPLIRGQPKHNEEDSEEDIYKMGIEEETLGKKGNRITDINVDLPDSENSFSHEKKKIKNRDIDLYQEEFMREKPKVPAEGTKKDDSNNPFKIEDD